MVRIKMRMPGRGRDASFRRKKKLSSSAEQPAIDKRPTESTTEKSSFNVSDDCLSEVSWDVSDTSNSNDGAVILLPKEKEAIPEVVFWGNVCQFRLEKHGPECHETADAFFNLGIAEMSVKAFEGACASFRMAAKAFPESSLGAAKHYALLGLATFRANQLDLAMESLRKSFDIRRELLGSLHVDTVDTFNHIAAVYSKQGVYVEASQCYEEVFVLRQAIFGRHHPSVAVTARILGRLYARMGREEDAIPWYVLALSTCHMTRKMKRMEKDIEGEMKMLGIEERPLLLEL